MVIVHADDDDEAADPPRIDRARERRAEIAADNGAGDHDQPRTATPRCR